MVGSRRVVVRGASVVVALLALWMPAAGATGADDGGPAVVPSVLGEIRKVHNLDLGDGRPAVELTVPAVVAHHRGSTVGCVLFFTDARGQYVKSAIAGYADREGYLRVVSRDTTAQTDRDAIDFVFRVPYGCFPKSPEGKYQVDVRARLFLRAANGTVVLATANTSFWVEG